MGVGHWVAGLAAASVATGVATVLVANKVVSGRWRGPAPSAQPTGQPPAAGSWQVLDPTQDIQLAPGAWYALVAMVKDSHDEAAIASLGAKYGLTFEEYLDPSPPLVPPLPDADPGYRYVAAVVQAGPDASAALPAKVPWFVPGDSSRIVKASVG